MKRLGFYPLGLHRILTLRLPKQHNLAIMGHAPEKWTNSQLHDVADLVYNLLKQSDAHLAIHEIDTALANGFIAGIETEDVLDLHRMVSNSTGVHGRPEKPAIRPPTEMSFSRAAISEKNSAVKRKYAKIVNDMVPFSANQDQVFETIMTQFRQKINVTGKRLIDIRVQMSKLKDQLIKDIGGIFGDFLLTAELDGITSDVTLKRPPARSLFPVGITVMRFLEFTYFIISIIS